MDDPPLPLKPPPELSAPAALFGPCEVPALEAVPAPAAGSESSGEQPPVVSKAVDQSVAHAHTMERGVMERRARGEFGIFMGELAVRRRNAWAP